MSDFLTVINQNSKKWWMLGEQGNWKIRNWRSIIMDLKGCVPPFQNIPFVISIMHQSTHHLPLTFISWVILSTMKKLSDAWRYLCVKKYANTGSYRSQSAGKWQTSLDKTKHLPFVRTLMRPSKKWATLRGSIIACVTANRMLLH